MKVKLLIFLGSIFFSTTLFGQVVFYNTGKMCVKGADTTSTKLYINGDFKAARKVGTGGCDVLSNGGKIILTGSLYHDAVGTMTERGATADTIVNVFRRGTTAGKLEFRSNTKQYIKSNGTGYATIPSKAKSYIEFPEYLEINNADSVIMDARVAGNAKNIEMKKGTFVLDSDLANVNLDYHPDTISAVGDARATSHTILAHLSIDGDITYADNPSSWRTTTNPSRIQVNFRMDQAQDVVLPTATNGANETSTYKRMYGMGSPYEAIRTDYFMFNTLAFLNKKGEVDSTEIRATERIAAGRGFTVGVDLRGDNSTAYIDRQSISDIQYFNNRNVNSYIFNRNTFNNGNNVNINDLAYSEEKLVTNSVKLPLVLGEYTALANPFMAPLSVKDLVTNNAQTGGWGNFTVGGNSSSGLYNQIWVLNPNAKAYEYRNIDPYGKERTYFNYNYTYWTIKGTGGTYVPDINITGEEFLISPLQMFMVYSYSANEITIPKSAVSHGETKFLRSSGSEWKRYDDFVFEVIDKETLTADRVCVVVREDSELRSATTINDNELNYKSQAVKVMEAGNNGFQLRSESLPAQSLRSILYLENDKGKALNEKTIPLSTYEEPLYLTPALVGQTIYIRGLRLNTMDKVKEIWLIDKHEGKKIRLTADNYYETVTTPDDGRDDRFILRFSQEITGQDEIVIKKELTAYYANDVLTVKTFVDEDFGSTIAIYDIKGQLINQVPVTDYIMNINQQLSNGVYIVKISGKNPYVTKILVK